MSVNFAFSTKTPSRALAVAAAAVLILTAAAASAHESLAQKVRAATSQYVNINVPLHNGEGWVVGTPCVSGPDFGAMGVHLVNPARLDGVVDVNAPEALIYEPLADGAMRLVGVEYIVIANAWTTLHPDGSTPALEGNLMNYIEAPNRYGLPAFYEIHVWAWQDNPRGTLADWNTQVSCDNQATS